MTIDINCGFGPGLDSQPELFGPLYPNLGAAELANELADTGIDRAALSAPPWLGGDFIDPIYERGNRAVHEAVQGQSGRLFGVGRVNPKFGARGLAVARQCLEEYGFRGLLFDVEIDGFAPLDVAGLDPYLSLCRGHRVPLLVVSGIHPSQPMIFVPLARAYPDVPIVLLRMGSFVPDDAIVAAGLADNLYLETSTQTPLEVKRAITQVGPERILFGSGFPYANIGVERDKIAKLTGLSSAARDAVLGGNATRLFGLTAA